MIPFGSQYYRPPTPQPHDWEKDIEQAKKYGIDVIRFWLMWSWINTKKDYYDFSEIEKLMNLSKKNNIKVILLFNLESSPAWLTPLYPEAMFVSRNNKKIYPDGVHNTQCGGFPGLCLDNEPVQKYAELFIKKSVEKFKDHPALYAWEPHNEPMIEPARYTDEVFCYCDATTNEFQKWLKNKYNNSLEKLNSFWKRRFSSFKEVIPPRERGSYADWIDWRIFSIDRLMHHLQWRTDAIRDIDKDHFIMAHVRGRSGLVRNPVREGIDDWKIANIVDKYGCAAFPQGEFIDDYFLATDAVRSAAQGKEFWMSELQGGPFGIGLKRNQPYFSIFGSQKNDAKLNRGDRYPEAGFVSPERLKMWSWIPISQGAKGLLYWCYRQELYGHEYGFGLTNIDGTPSDRLEMAKNLSSKLKKYEHFIDNSRVKPAQIAIGFTPINFILNWVAEENVDMSRDAVSGIYNLLWNSNHNVDFVRLDDDIVNDDYSKYKIIFLPLPLWISEKSSEKLIEFVKNGGVVISEASLSQYDEQFFSSPIVPGNNLNKLFGVTRLEISSHSEFFNISLNNQPVKTTFYKEILIPTTAEPIGYDGNNVIAVKNNFGKGSAYYIGSNPFISYLSYQNENFKKFINNILNNLGIQATAETNNMDIIVKSLFIDKDTDLIFIFNTSSKPIDAEITISTDKTNIIETIEGDKINYTKDNNKIIINNELKEYDTRIFVIKK